MSVDENRSETSTLLRPWALIPLLVVASVAVRLWAFVGIVRLDMFRYLEISNHVLHGGSLYDPQVIYYSVRLPLMLPLIVSNALGGYGEHVSVLWPLACSVGSVVVAYLLGRELFGDVAGALSGALMALFPLEVEMGTQLLPDAIEGFFILAMVYFAVLGITRDVKWRKWPILAGIFLVISYQTRTNAVIFLPGILAIGAIVRPERWKRSLWALVGLAIGAGLFAAVFWMLSGDPLIDIHKMQQFYSGYESAGFFVRQATFTKMILTERALVWTAPLALLGLAGLALWPDRNKALLAVWAVGFFIYLEFVSRLHGLDSSYRYAEPLIAPILILAAAAVAQAGKDRSRRTVGVAAFIGGLVVMSMLQLGAQAANHRRSQPRWAAQRTLARIAVAKPDTAFYLDDNWLIVALNYYSGFTLGRDTVEPPSAGVNAKARLFLLSERIPPAGSRAVVVTTKPANAPADSVPEQTIPYPGGPLIIYRVR